MGESQKVIQCFHCGNETLMNMVGEHEEDDYEGEDLLFSRTTSRLYSCPVCRKVTVLETYWDFNLRYYDHNGDEKEYSIERMLYPIAPSFDNNKLPNEVRTAFNAALKCKNIDRAICSIALRRTLEIICKDKQAAGNSLWKKIEDLSKKGVLPPELEHASTITRFYGNIGAHDTKVDISRSDLDLIIEFVEYILDYLYILPAKLKEMQEKMSHQQSNAPMLEQIGTAPESEDNENT